MIRRKLCLVGLLFYVTNICAKKISFSRYSDIWVHFIINVLLASRIFVEVLFISQNSRRHVLYILISCLTARAPFAHETEPRTNMTYTILDFFPCVILAIWKHFVWFFAKIKVPLWVLYKLSTFGQQKWVVSCRWFNNTLNNGSPR